MASVNDGEDRDGWVDKFTEETDNTGAVELTALPSASTGDPPVSSNDVEPDVTQKKGRTRVDSKDVRIKKYDSIGTRRQKMKNLEKFLETLLWRKMIGWRGFVLILAMVTAAVGHFFLFYTYTSAIGMGFFKIGREWAWVFILFSLLFAHLSLVHCVFWRRRTYNWVSRKYGTKVEAKLTKITFQNAHRWYVNSCGLDGSYYLARLYFNEFMESWYQIFTISSTYVCMLPMPVTLFLLALLFIESTNRAWVFRSSFLANSELRFVSVSYRNFQVYLDCCIDFLALCGPISIIWFGYGMPIIIEEALLMTVVPSLFLYTKLKRMFDETVRRHVEKEILALQMKRAKSFKRNRRSIFGEENKLRIARIQNQYLPRVARRLIVLTSLLSSTFLLSIIVVQLARVHEGKICTTMLGADVWDDGCFMKVPYCKDLYVPSCDCAVLELNAYNSSELPAGFNRMTNMRKLNIVNSGLERMPKGIDTAFASMSEFRVSESMLTSFDFDVQKWRHLIHLDLMGNRLKSIHESVWSHPHLMNLYLDDNVGLQIPSSESLAISLPNLQSFFFMNNSAHIPRDVFNNKNFPILLLLYLNGNIMATFPDSFESLKNKVSAVGVARMGLTKLPAYLSDFSRLTYIDLRDNNISSVDSALSSIISRNQITAYFSGNDVCQTPSAKFLDCVPLCSKFCWNRNHGTNKYCDRSCNSALCDFDWGECSSN